MWLKDGLWWLVVRPDYRRNERPRFLVRLRPSEQDHSDDKEPDPSG